MTPATRIRWDDNGTLLGYVGTFDHWLYQIFKASDDADDSKHVLLATLPGALGDYCLGTDPDKLKAEAERWLTRFIASLGAVFPEDAYEFPDDDELLEVKFAAGTRVRFAHPDYGYPGEAEEAMKALIPGKVYTIAWADIGQSRTDLNLAANGKSLGRFNSVLFEPVTDHPAATAAEEE